MIFCIGLPKTGTCSLASALEQLGRRPLHHSNFLGSLIGFNRWRGARLLALADREFDAFADGPVADIYPELDDQYPHSRFIWTVRELQSWLDSVLGHIRRLRSEVGSLTDDPAAWLERWHEHERQVRGYFDGRDDLLEFDVGSGWPPLCHFLGCEIPDAPFPYENTRSD